MHWLGRKQGRLKAISDAWLKTAPTEARKPLGLPFNKLNQQIDEALDAGTENASADIAVKDAAGFTALSEQAKSSLTKEHNERTAAA